MVRLQARLRGPVSELGGLRAILELVLRSPAGRPGEYRPRLRRGYRRRGLRCRYWVLGPRLHGRLERAFEHKSYVHGLTTRKYRPVHRPTREDLRRGAWLHAKLRGSAPHAGSLSRARSRSRDHRGRCRRPRPRHLHGRGDDRAEHDPPHDRIGGVRQTPHHRGLHGGRAATASPGHGAQGQTPSPAEVAPDRETPRCRDGVWRSVRRHRIPIVRMARRDNPDRTGLRRSMHVLHHPGRSRSGRLVPGRHDRRAGQPECGPRDEGNQTDRSRHRGVRARHRDEPRGLAPSR